MSGLFFYQGVEGGETDGEGGGECREKRENGKEDKVTEGLRIGKVFV